MIDVLEKYDSVTAAGILARAAIAVDDADNPACAPRLAGELDIRALLLDGAKRNLADGADVGEYLDALRESIASKVDSAYALTKLAEKGQLPSDLYLLQVIDDIKKFWGSRFDIERKLIEATVFTADREQHFGPPESRSKPFLISLFSKVFVNQNPTKTYTMLVAGQRKGTLLEIHQAWRLYHDLVDTSAAGSLVDLLGRFAGKYGIEVEVGNKKGHLILAEDIPKGDVVTMSYDVFQGVGRRTVGQGGVRVEHHVTVTCFVQQNPWGRDVNQAALVVGIDLNKYRKMLDLKGW